MDDINCQLDIIQNYLEEIGLSGCLYEIILIALIEVGRPTECRWYRSLAENPDCLEGEKASACIHLYLFPYVKGCESCLCLDFSGQHLTP